MPGLCGLSWLCNSNSVKPASQGNSLLSSATTPVIHIQGNSSSMDEDVANQSKDDLPWWMKVPVFNFFAQFFACVPTYEGTTQLLNILGLVGALVLALIITLACSTTYEDLTAADVRFMTPGSGYYEFWDSRVGKKLLGDKTASPSKVFAFYSSVSAVMVFTEVLLVLIMYVCLTMSGVDIKDKKQEQLLLRAWYKCNRFVLVIVVMLLIVGIAFFVVATWYMFQIKYPDYYVADHGKKSSADVYGFVEIFNWSLVAMLVIFGGVSTWGNALVAHQKHKHGIHTQNGVKPSPAAI